MSNIEAWNYIVAVLTPFLVALINRPSWSSDVKRLVMVAVAFVIALVTAWLNGAFSPFDAGQILQYAVFMIGATQVSFAALKAVPVTRTALDKTEVAASGTSAREAIVQKAAVKDQEIQDFQSNVAPELPPVPGRHEA